MKSRIKLRFQLIFIFAIIFLLSTLLIGIAYGVLLNYLQQNTLKQSLNIITLENNVQLSSQLKQYEMRIDTILSQIYQKQTIFNQVHNFVQKNQNRIQIVNPYYCPSYINDQMSQSMFCLMANGYLSTNVSSIKGQVGYEFQFISLFHESLMMIDATQFIVTGIAYTTNQSIPILGTWPSLNATISYNPHLRTWYKGHISQMASGQQHIFSDLFTSWFDSYTIAISSNITDIYGEFSGVVFDLLDFQAFKQNFKSNYFLINSEGQLILSYFNYPANSTKPIYIQNQTITGFDEEDWSQIQLSAKNEEILSNCQINNYIQQNNLCRYNHLFEQDVLMMIKQLVQPPYIMVMYLNLLNRFINATETYESILDLHSQIEDSYIENMITTSMILVGTAFFLLIVFLFFLKLILDPLETLIRHSASQFKNQKTHFSHQQWMKLKYFDESESDSNNTIFLAKQAYLNMLKNSQAHFKKGIECKKIEEIQYPRGNRWVIHYNYCDIPDQEKPRKMWLFGKFNFK